MYYSSNCCLLYDKKFTELADFINKEAVGLMAQLSM